MGKKKKNKPLAGTEGATTNAVLLAGPPIANDDIQTRLYGGEAPKITLQLAETRRANIGLFDAAKAVCWLLCDEAEAQKWFFVQGRPLLRSVVVVVVDGLTEEAFYTHEVPCLRGPGWQFAQMRVGKGGEEAVLFDFFMMRVKPAEDPAEALLRKQSKLAKEAHKRMSVASCLAALQEEDTAPTAAGKRERDERAPDEGTPETYPFPVEDYLASLEDLEVTGLLPAASLDDPTFRTSVPWVSGVIDLPPAPVVAVDCEMCLTAIGPELTRVTIVDAADCAVLYDHYVRPHNPIVNYMTCYSGVTEETLADVTRDLAQVQDEILSEFIFAHTILVGHSLENDVAALKLRHTRFVDTSIIFPHPAGAGRKHALRYLTKKYLDRQIQGDESGHCSVEDATACVDLLRLKQKHGKDFGNERSPRQSILVGMQHNGVRCTLIDRVDTVRNFVTGNASLVGVNDDVAAVQRAMKIAAQGPGTEGRPGAFTFVHLCKTPHAMLNEALTPLMDALPSRTVVVVVGLRPEDPPVDSTEPAPATNMGPAYGLFAVKVKT